MRDRVEQEELDFDTQQGLWKPSLFDLAEDVCEELEPEPIPVHGHYKRIAGKDVFIPAKMKFVGPEDGFQLLVEDK